VCPYVSTHDYRASFSLYSASDLYFGGVRFESHLRHKLHWLRSPWFSSDISGTDLDHWSCYHPTLCSLGYWELRLKTVNNYGNMSYMWQRPLENDIRLWITDSVWRHGHCHPHKNKKTELDLSHRSEGWYQKSRARVRQTTWGCKVKGKTKIEVVECIWTYIKTGRITNWGEICRNRKEWKKAVQEAKVHLGLN